MGHELVGQILPVNTGTTVPSSVEIGLHPDVLSKTNRVKKTRPFVAPGLNPASVDGHILVRQLAKNRFDPNDIDRGSIDVHDKEGNRKGSLYEQTQLQTLSIENIEDTRAWGMNVGVTVVMSKRRFVVKEIYDENGIKTGSEITLNYDIFPGRFTVGYDDKTGLTPTSGIEIFKTIERVGADGKTVKEPAHGKNYTPLPEHPEWGEVALLRLDNNDNKHALSLVHPTKDRITGESMLTEIKKIEVPKDIRPSWMSERIGTGGGPIMDEKTGEPILDVDGNMTLIIHGQELVPEKDNEGKEIQKIVYRLGAIKVDKDWNLVGVSEEPIAEKKDFSDAPELRGEKIVVYLCDTPRRASDGTVGFYVAAGDTETYYAEMNEKDIDSQIFTLDELRQKKAAQQNLSLNKN